MKNNSILIFLPDSQFNEAEFLTVKKKLENDGINIFIASDAVNTCEGNFNLKVKADINFFNIHEANFAGIIFIGGTGTRNYWNKVNAQLVALEFVKAGKITAAICSAVIILAKAGILDNKKATCFPGDKLELINSKIVYTDEPVVISRNIITAGEPDASSQFADAIVQKIRAQNFH